jgi:hypothetical protein
MTHPVQPVASPAGAVPVGPSLLALASVTIVCLLASVAWVAGASAQGTPSVRDTDLDTFMSKVLARRDENWKKLQQYVLEERETLQLIGPAGTPLYGLRRESAWFPRDGVFIKSPLRADGVPVGEADRRRAEQEWLKREERREQRRVERERDQNAPAAAGAPLTEDGIRQALEPGFVSAAYFLRFKFDPGQYALAGRETLEGRDVLRIEYYPTKLFSEGRSRPNREIRERDRDVQAKMNKVSLVTLWIDPAEQQILKYEFQNVDMDFLPGRSMIRIDGLDAAMEMGQPFPSVWLPRSLRIGFDMSLAVGEIDGRYSVDYYDYKLATVATKVR